VSEVTLYLADEEAMTALAHVSPKRYPRARPDFSRRAIWAWAKPRCRGASFGGLGHVGAVKSPTFTLVEPYEIGDIRAFHFDLYRLVDPEELEFLGIRDYFEDDALCLIEWPDKGAGFLPKPDLTITISPQDSGRSLKILSQGSRGEAWCAALALESK
jgi:tRNA threonylcarbamoyladenosine biosynthesis protein TsaE